MTIEQALLEQRYETARRLCLEALAEGTGARVGILLALHTAYRKLGDIRACRATLAQVETTTGGVRLDVLLRMAEDYHLLSGYDFYRGSEEAAAGLTGDEYQERYRGMSAKYLEQARAVATLPGERARVAAVLKRVGRGAEAARLVEVVEPTAEVASAGTGVGRVACRIRHADGRAVARVRVTLGLQIEREESDPGSYCEAEMHYVPRFGADAVRTALTDEAGRCEFAEVPAGRQEYVAITDEAIGEGVPTRFLAQGIEVAAGKRTELELTAGGWRSAARREVKSPFAAEMTRGGVRYRRVVEQVMANPFCFHFPRQVVRMVLPEGVGGDPRKLLLLSSEDAGAARALQVCGREVAFFAELQERTDRVWAVYEADGEAAEPERLGKLTVMPEGDGRSAVIGTGRAEFRIPWGAGADDRPPLLAVRGADGVWRGRGRMVLPGGVSVRGRRTEILDAGDVLVRVRVAYELSNGMRYAVTWTAHEREAYLLAEEESPALEGAAFEFSLAELVGGRGFLHWTPEGGNVHWRNLERVDREMGRLQESVAWWIPPQGFGYAMTAEGLSQQDYIGVYTVRRGEWVDRAFAMIAQGPGDEGRELDWPYPEMVGSTISMITARTAAGAAGGAGDAYFRFAFFDGVRQWGILVSTLARNDGQWKEISAVQHKNSSPRLQDFMHWRLDEPDAVERPSVVVRRGDLPALRAKRSSPTFKRYWEAMCAGKTPGAAAGVRFAVEGDPRIAWRKKLELVGVAHIRAKMTLLGRDYSDMYSPVGARPITPWAEEYDLIAASGVFTPEEERLVRSFLMLMSHMYMSPDLMNWKFNSRNANFEADRTDVVGVIGLTFHGNPDAGEFVRHAAASMDRALGVYCTPGSGKWYENPACYYLQAGKCRMNFAFHMAQHGIEDATANPRLKEFLRWGILLLMPPTPESYEQMRAGLSEGEYQQVRKVRRIAPVGDHALIGPWVPEFYALAAKLYRQRDPEFANELLWAYQVGGGDGGYFGNKPLLFSALTEEDLQPARAEQLGSRRLEGFGAVFRGKFGAPDEFYLLFKQGPGGYRYHRTEGSILLFANGKPLIYDGGEAGETWRHSTLSFEATHMPLAPGHVERFASFAGLDFVQGVHPVALGPGDAVFLSEVCEHRLVEVAKQRYAEPNPADVRSVVWVKDEYVVLHDDLALPGKTPTHWHLQVVSDSHTGNWREGYRFAGRFGTDLQVLLPGQAFAAEKVEQVPMLEHHLPVERRFAMRHLMLSGEAPQKVMAVLRPLWGAKEALAARLIETGGRTVGVEVRGREVHDQVFLARTAGAVEAGGVEFSGRYGAVLRRAGHTDYVLIDGGFLRWATGSLESTGPRVELRVAADKAQLVAEGQGRVTVRGFGEPRVIEVDGLTRVDLRGFIGGG